MKRLVLIFCIIMFGTSFACASSINAAAYRTMQASSYRNHYNSQVSNQMVPYWQAQSNYATRNRLYNNYTNYNNSVNQFNYTTRMYRGR